MNTCDLLSDNLGGSYDLGCFHEYGLWASDRFFFFFRVPKGFRAPGLRPKICRDPGLQHKNIGAPGLHSISFGAPGFTVIK